MADLIARSWKDRPTNLGNDRLYMAVCREETHLQQKILDLGLERALACTATRLRVQRLSAAEWCACAEFIRRHREEPPGLARARDEAHLRRVIQLQRRAPEMPKPDETPLVKGGQGREAEDHTTAAIVLLACFTIALLIVLCLLGA